MIIFPAIDLMDGQAVRLYKGEYDRRTTYSDDPVAVAKDFAEQGAAWVHLVDLDGAKSGLTPNFDVISRIKDQSGLKCEVGGGIRAIGTVERYLSAGIDRVIIGTAAVTDPDFLRTALERYGEQIAVGIDIRDGRVSIRGWTEDSGLDALEFAKKMQLAGVRTMICTDISKDGAMQGTNRALYRELSDSLDMDITASGGVSSLDDVAALRAMEIYGAIIGKAYYTGAIDLRKAIEVAG